MKARTFDAVMFIVAFWVDTYYDWPDDSYEMAEQLYAKFRKWA